MGANTQEDKNRVYLVDFGLAKEHLDPVNFKPMEPRRNTDFRGTIPYASLNAHNKEELSRRDDIWSFYFMMLEFFDEQLTWKQSKPCSLTPSLDSNKDQVREQKMKAFKNPKKLLFPNIGRKFEQIKDMYDYLLSLKYHDQPNYKYFK